MLAAIAANLSSTNGTYTATIALRALTKPVTISEDTSMRRQRATMGLTRLSAFSLFPGFGRAGLSLSGCAFSLSIASQGNARAGQHATRRRDPFQQVTAHERRKKGSRAAAAATSNSIG